MKLYERVRKLPKIIGIDGKEFSTGLGVNYSTFNGYLTSRREHLLWPLLPKILERWPGIARQWLYFGEGPATYGRAYSETGRPLDQRRILQFAERMAEDCKGDWLEVVREIIGLARNQVENGPQSAESIAKLENEIAELKAELKNAREISEGLTKKFVLGIADEPHTGKVAGGRG